MHLGKSHRYRLSICTAAVFAVQLFAIAFCFDGQAQATPMAGTHAMAAACSMDMETPIKQQAPARSHCAMPDTGPLASDIGSPHTGLPLATIITDTWHVTSIGQVAQIHHIARTQAPPNSASLIYQTTLRIRL